MDLLDQAIAAQEGRGVRTSPFCKNKEDVKKGVLLEYFASLTVFLVIISFEVIVCWRGFHFFRGVDFDFATAIVLSCGCEVLYMFASSQSDKRLVFFRFILLSLSMTFLGYSTYKSDENLVYFKADLVTEKSNITSEIKHYERQLKRIEKDLNTLDGSMKVYLKHDLVTKGLKTIAPERERLAQERGRVKASLAGLKNGLGKLNSRLVSVNLIDTLEILTIKTYVTLVTFFVFQTLICIILPDILSKVFIKEGE